MRIGIFLFDGCEELDWAGPWEVLTSWANAFPDRQVEVVTIARDPGLVTCAKGLRVMADHSWADCPTLDVLVYPGGQGTRRDMKDAAVLHWVKNVAALSSLMASVCTGSLVYGAAGLLDHRPATTHWAALDELAALGRPIDLRPDDRFVDDGEVVTSAGVSAGIDMALHLVIRLGAEDEARAVKRAIQYDPEPPV